MRFPRGIMAPVPASSVIRFALRAAVWFALCTGQVWAQSPYDVVLSNGRVMDPASGLDAVRHVGIVDGRIAAISAEPLRARLLIDVSGLVVAPGFIDLNAHGQDPFSTRLKAQDGVTTALNLEGGTGPSPVAGWYAEREGKAIINYGAAASHFFARVAAIQDSLARFHEHASAEQIATMQNLLRKGLREGALGIGYGLQYVRGAGREEVLRMFELAAEHGVPNFVHLRHAGSAEPTSALQALQEVVANAAATGASLHVLHIGSNGLGQVPVILDVISGARRNGLDVTAEVYPYTAGLSGIETALFDPGWQERLDADYGDIEWLATGERLTAESFARYREQGGGVIVHVIPESMVDTALAHPAVMIASDGAPFIDGRGHPRGAGTFSRVLGRYVREKQVLTLMEALRKMTLLPAQRLEAVVPGMRSKGRMQVGADADIVVFDAGAIIDEATFAEPTRPSSGIVHVLVGGTFVVKAGSVVEGAYPGKPIRR